MNAGQLIKKTTIVGALACAGSLAAVPTVAQAQTDPDAWKYTAIIYGYFPDIGGSTKFPQSGGGSNVTINSDAVLDSLNFAFMGTFEATKGRWGILADVLYMDLSNSVNKTRDLTFNGQPLPAGVTANADLGLRGTVFELAGVYKAFSDSKSNVDFVAGARLLDIQSSLTLELSADIGNDTGPGRSHTTSVHPTYWDVVVGAKGQYRFGSNGEWSIPWYVDVGTGESKLTYQAIAGLAYKFNWGQVIGAWRYLDYDFKSGSDLESINFNGPMVGVAFNW